MSASDADIGTRLNGWDEGPLGPLGPAPAVRPDLSVHADVLRPIGEDARALARVRSTGYHPAPSSGTAATALRAAGLGAGNGLSHAAARFWDQAANLARDCERIAEHLGGTVTQNAAVEADIQGRLQAQGAPRVGNPVLDALAE